jgi:hypothetical protein
MPRYLIERTFVEELHILLIEESANVCRTVVDNNECNASTSTSTTGPNPSLRVES